jgi:transglutaminase-like putative cysteine protease
MTARTATEAAPVPSRTLGELFASLPFHPNEGWVSLFATAVMAVVVALSFIDAGWTLGGPIYSGFLPWVALVGVAFGVAGAKIGWGRWRTHLVGALFAGIALPLIVGGIVRPDAGWDVEGLGIRYAYTFIVARNVWTDLVVNARPYTTESAYYHLVLGTLVWGAGLLAGFTVFGHRRPLDAVVVLGLVLIADMAVSRHDQLLLLIIFSCAALLLLIRTHVFEEEVTWARRKIGDPAAVRSLYLIAGTQFVAITVLGAVLLTWTASSAPLQGLWKDLPQHLSSISQWLQRIAPPGGEFRGLGAVTFGDNAITNGQWQPSDRVAFRVRFPRGEAEQFKWRAGTYAQYTGYGWDWGETRTEPTAARAVLLDGDVNGDRPTPEGRREIELQIIPDAFVGSTVLAPNTLFTVDRDTNALVLGASGWFTTVETTSGSSAYSVTALVPVFEDKAGGIAEPQLRAAGTDYPAELKAIYTALPPDAMGVQSTALLNIIRAAVNAPKYADPANPYDLARTMQDYLRDNSRFTYDEDVRDERNAQCAGVSTVECFARIKRGYCDYYASTMAVLLRASGIPARVAYGFLPGAERGTDGVEVVGAWLAHYWVEVYFPGIGWIEFDPTGGGIGEPQAIPSGSPLPATARPSGPGATFRNNTNGPSFGTGGPGGPTTPTNPGVGPFIAIALILVMGVIALIYAALRRAPRRPMHPDQAWGSLSRLAGRFGLGPRPSQTVYEYAGALGDTVPAARVELTTIARAKVEFAYGRHELGVDGLRRVAEAYQRLRFALLGFILRRGLRRGRAGGRGRGRRGQGRG